MSEYRDELTKAMNMLAADPRRRFIGYGLLDGRAGGTLKNVPPEQIIETPVAENLMVGLAVGISLANPSALNPCAPVVFIERMDFILNALDAIVNHLDKIGRMSGWQFSPKVILRVVVGNSTTGLRTGATHTQDFREAVQQMVGFRVIHLPLTDAITPMYFSVRETGETAMLVEYKDLW